ncbi:hypothetical protein PL8927_750017 [Planktothrix serta PCC 8927]|uniref:DarT domain-containing protein n=2 Tax=Planktothrix TaxID=54304 RepID=A0A7Z9E298_9CYAN|nr:DarT ssDNA thymidine ADP-ribosyltransferase family protein [Planktothrix serta]VXD22306.1 hypothetical protein PL8927_750017 [Planktothrix serta PCC 8927]
MSTIAPDTTKLVEIGIVKWFDKSDQDLDYRILTLEDERRWKLHHQEIKCSESELKRGRFIRFEIQDNKIKNLNLLREVGIMDWYQKDKGFGCALLQRDDLLTFFEKQTKGKAEVFVHINQISCSNEDLKEGVAVVFDIKKNFSRDNQLRDNATHLTLLTQETNPEIIEACALSQDVKLWYPVFKLYLNSFNADQLKVYFCLQKLNTLTKSSTGIRGCTLSQQSFADEIPDNILIASQELINYISLQKLINLVINAENNNSDILWNELINRLQNLPETDLHWKTIPEDIVSNERIWSLLPNQNRIKILVSKLSNSSNPEKLISEIGGILNNSSQTDHSELLCLIPENLKKYPTIFELLSDSEKVKLLFLSLDPLISSLSEQQQKTIVNDIRHKISSKFIKFLSFLKDAKKTILLDIPPVEISEELDQELFDDGNITSKNRVDSISNNLYNPLPTFQDELEITNDKIPIIETVEQRLDGSDAAQIRAFVALRKISCLCHFTTIENLKGICSQGGLLSNTKLQERNQHYKQIDSGRWDGQHNHICCSINGYNSMYHYHARQNHRTDCWVLLAIKPDYLWKQNTLFCQMNAASRRGAYIKTRFEGLESMFVPEVRDIGGRLWTRGNLPDCRPTCLQAEVLVYESISLADILLIWVNEDPGNVQKVIDAGWTGEIKIWKGVFKS